MQKYNISANLVRTIEQLYDKATSAVQMNGSIGEWLRTTVGVRQGCLLSPTLFNIFLERIMSDALEEHDGKVSIGGRNITNLRFADDIDALAEEEQELEATKVVQIMTLVDPDLFHSKVKFGHIGICMGKSENYYFLETIAVLGLIVA